MPGPGDAAVNKMGKNLYTSSGWSFLVFKYLGYLLLYMLQIFFLLFFCVVLGIRRVRQVFYCCYWGAKPPISLFCFSLTCNYSFHLA